jgi:peptidoglycan-N-acetylglucosamine deacetylase
LLDEDIKNHKNTSISKIGKWVICLSFLFFISFFVGIKIYQIKMPVNAAGLDKTSLVPRLTSDEMNKREGKISPTSAGEVQAFNPYKNNGKKIAYLTFDDGPSKENTPKILRILKKYKINATFFVIGNIAKDNIGLVKTEYLDGNTIGNHTYDHVYNHLYSSTQAFEEEIYETESLLKSILGVSYKTKLVRFPGGSFGLKLKPFRDVILKDGYHYVDWNALDGDAEATNIPPAKLFIRLKQTVGMQEHVVILMHDTSAKNTTVQILPQIIQYLIIKGYSFSTLQ